MSHHCPALVIHCMDFRFHSAIRDWLISLGLKDQCDLVSLAGATKGLADRDQSSTEIILKQIDIARQRHGIREVYIMHHLDCGAYGGRAAFRGVREEHAKQVADMTAAASIIQQHYPNLTVAKVLARIDEGNGKSRIDFEAIP
jgi:hypothetical protein